MASKATYDLNYTLATLAARVNSSPEALAPRVKVTGRMDKEPIADDKIPDSVCTRIVGAFDALQAASKAPNNVIALPQSNSSPEAATEEPMTESGSELSRIDLKDIKAIAKQHKISQGLAIELEEELFQRQLYLTFLQAQVRADAQEGVEQAVYTSRKIAKVEEGNKRLDEAELELLKLQDATRLESVDEKFGLGLQSTVDRMFDAAQQRAEKELKRKQWLEDLEAGKELPEEALSDPFVLYAFSKKTA